MAETSSQSSSAGVGATPGYDEDPWTRVRTVHGIAADELISALQKSIRRGLVEQAALIAYEMYASGVELEGQLWKRLQVISVEDVGFGWREAPAVIDALYRMHRRVPRSDVRFLYALHAVRLLALCPKDRTSDEMAWWTSSRVDSGTELPRIPDYALDVHTRRGREMGRGDEHWLREGAVVSNEIPDRDVTYRSRLLAMLANEHREA